MGPSYSPDDEDAEIYKLVQSYIAQGDHIKALEVIEDSISTRGLDKLPRMFSFLQGWIFFELANRTENSDVKFAFLLSSVECFTVDCAINALTAVALFDMAKQLDSVLYYKRAVKEAKAHLKERMVLASSDGTNKKLENIIEVAESKIRKLGLTRQNYESKPRDLESKDVPNTIRSDSNTAAGERLRSYWAGMDVESKRNFLNVSTTQLRSYVERLYGREGQDALEQVLDSARINRKWKFWMCRTCSQKFYYPKKLRNHLEQEHAAKFKPSTTNVMAQRVDEAWAGMISVAGWKPVDTVAAVDLIKTRLEFVKGFVYENGWSKDWPLASDEERSKLLKEIQLLLVLFWERKILSCSIRDWMMRFPIKHLAEFEVSESTLTTECRLVETPQSICFLECCELNQILDLLKVIKWERDDGTYLICRAVDHLSGRCRVKEKIGFDHQFSSILLDKRLLRGNIASFDDEGTIDVCDKNVYYSKTQPQGDDIITWLLDYLVIDESFEFPRSIRAYNLDIWVAILRAIHYTCRSVGTKYANKLCILWYDAGLIDAINICICEEKRRRSVPELQYNKYASLLYDKCEEILRTEAEGSPNTLLFLCAIRDVLEEASQPKFDFPYLKDCLKLIHGHKNLSDEIVWKSILLLRSLVANKIPLVDSKILLAENSRINLLNELTRLSAFDYRSYILHLLKLFLREALDGTVDKNVKAKAAAAQTELVSGKKQEKEKNSRSKKKKNRGIKKTSMSIPSLLDQSVKEESSINLEPGVTSPSLGTVEKDSMEPERTLISERGLLEISSSTENQEEAAKGDLDDMQNVPGGDLLSAHLDSALGEGAVRCNSALDMTLKALCNIKILKEYLVHNRFSENMEEQVPYALQNFPTAFVSKQIKEEGLHNYLLANLLASLEEVHSMSSNAAKLLVSIFKFWPCWKSPQRESLVTHIFTLEEYERMSCKCGRKPNYPEQSSYGLVVAADSIRDLKCAFGNIEFGDILKVIRIEDTMLCDIKTGGCGKANFVHHIISRCPPIFTIVLEWEKNETEKEISETTKAMDWEIDIGRLYEGLEPNTKYRLVSMVGYGEEE